MKASRPGRPMCNKALDLLEGNFAENLGAIEFDRKT